MADAQNTEHSIEVIKPVSITPKEYARSTEFSVLNEPSGAVAIAFAELEAQLTATINALLNLEYKDGVALEDLNNFRNDLIHGNWTTWYEDGSFGKVRYRADVGGLHPIQSLYKMKIEDIWEAHKAIFKCSLAVATWRHVFNHRDQPQFWPSSWRDKLK